MLLQSTSILTTTVKQLHNEDNSYWFKSHPPKSDAPNPVNENIQSDLIHLILRTYDLNL